MSLSRSKQAPKKTYIHKINIIYIKQSAVLITVNVHQTLHLITKETEDDN